MILKEALKQYKKYTIELIENVKDDKYSEVEVLLGQREKIINSIKEMDYTKEEFKEIENEFQILQLEKELENIVGKKRDNAKEQLNKIKENRNANKNYTKRYSVDSLFFNKKI